MYWFHTKHFDPGSLYQSIPALTCKFPALNASLNVVQYLKWFLSLCESQRTCKNDQIPYNYASFKCKKVLEFPDWSMRRKMQNEERNKQILSLWRHWLRQTACVTSWEDICIQNARDLRQDASAIAGRNNFDFSATILLHFQWKFLCFNERRSSD
jgi:hypothetical protein